jgi:hypothetical protein
MQERALVLKLQEIKEIWQLQMVPVCGLHELIHFHKSARYLREILGKIDASSFLVHDLCNYPLWGIA